MAEAIINSQFILENPQGVEKELLKLLKEEAIKRFKNLTISLTREIGLLISEAITNSDEWHSLIGGQLRAEFGLADPAPALHDILDTILGSIEIIVFPGAQEDLVGLQIIVLRDGLDRLTSLQSASYISERSGEMIDWLKWLLFGGGDVIIDDYRILFGESKGRTGQAIMVRSTNFGVGWSVPYQYVGTENNNWLTRTLTPISPLLIKLIEEHVQKQFGDFYS